MVFEKTALNLKRVGFLRKEASNSLGPIRPAGGPVLAGEPSEVIEGATGW